MPNSWAIAAEISSSAAAATDVVEGAAAAVAEWIDDPMPLSCSDAAEKASGAKFKKDDIVVPI
ncbi:hypothetical protein MCNS_39430 [Mycobacterium conspicuum]|uniref:Uncharacterized protein n=1 Tax=Mycobacterium conspicuum TaxID=44010 RepID=A0A7I7YGG7_9MYCO|nr:hypothetical protein MCNS_39430 [Mycobacterium conspicuum]